MPHRSDLLFRRIDGRGRLGVHDVAAVLAHRAGRHVGVQHVAPVGRQVVAGCQREGVRDVGGLGNVGGGHHRAVDLVLHVGDALGLVGELRLRQRVVGRHVHERERVQLVVALGREDVHRAMVVELGGVAEVGQAGEHRAVVQMVPVDDVVRVGEVARVLGRQEDGAERGDPPLRALEVVREVLHVVGGLHDGVVHHGAGDVDPAHRVGVDGLERVPVHREVGQRRSLNIAGRREALLRDALVGLLALPVAEADGAERGQGHDEHHERDPEHDPPRAALLLGTPGTGLLMTRVLLVRVDPRRRSTGATRVARGGRRSAVR